MDFSGVTMNVGSQKNRLKGLHIFFFYRGNSKGRKREEGYRRENRVDLHIYTIIVFLIVCLCAL